MLADCAVAGRINSGLASLVPIFLSMSASLQKVTGSLQKVTGMSRRPGKMLSCS